MPDTSVGAQPKIASSNYSSLSDPVANVSATRPNFYLLLTQPPLPPQTPTLPRNHLRSHPNRHHHPNPQILHHRQPLVTLIMSNSFSPFLTLKSPGGIPPKKPEKTSGYFVHDFQSIREFIFAMQQNPTSKNTDVDDEVHLWFSGTIFFYCISLLFFDLLLLLTIFLAWNVTKYVFFFLVWLLKFPYYEIICTV